MNELPSFLAQTGPSSYVLTLSSSAADTFSLCEAKYSWSRVTGIEAAVARAGMNYGKALHLLLAARYGATAYDLQAILEKHFAENPQPTTGSKGRPEWRTAARASQAFQAYLQAYPAEDFEVLGVEEPFECELGSFATTSDKELLDALETSDELPQQTTVTVRIRGIRDLRVRWHEQLWVLDHKTSTEWSDLTIDEGKASFQFMCYAWVEREMQRLVGTNRDVISTSVLDGAQSLPVGGVIGNYIISRENYANADRKPTARDLPRDQFERHAYSYSDSQLAEWHGDAMDIARAIWAAHQRGEWRRNRTACAHWGRCEYYRLCWETEPEWRMSAAQGADFRARTPSPFEDEANGKERQ